MTPCGIRICGWLSSHSCHSASDSTRRADERPRDVDVLGRPRAAPVRGAAVFESTDVAAAGLQPRDLIGLEMLASGGGGSLGGASSASGDALATGKTSSAGSIFGDPLFLDPDNGNFCLDAASPALALGFAEMPEDVCSHC